MPTYRGVHKDGNSDKVNSFGDEGRRRGYAALDRAKFCGGGSDRL